MEQIVDKIRLDGKTAVITGGHSGIGRGITEAFAQAGADIAIVGRRKELGESVAQKVAAAYGRKIRFVQADITKPEDRERLINEVLAAFGKIDILVNDAGMTIQSKAEEVTYEQWRTVMDINLDALFFLSQAVGKVMIRQGGGNIVNISSNSDNLVMTPQCQAVYNASKAGVDMVTKCLAYEWAQYHIRVNAIAPGYVQSDILPEGVRPSDGKPFCEVWKEMIPLGRFAKPEEIGAMALYIASDMSPFLTGSVLLIDGGYSLT